MGSIEDDIAAAIEEEEKEYNPLSGCAECACEADASEYDCGEDCPCQTDHCDYCGCGTQEWPSGDGCSACYAHYEATGNVDPCNGWNDCYYADNDEDEDHEPPEDKPRLFSIKHLPVADIDEVNVTGERAVAKQLGLDPHLNLAQACADYYVLERLYQDSHDLAARYDAAEGRTKVDVRVPMESGRDSRRERLAIAIAKSRESLNRELSNQLLRYMVMAVGGELRHAPAMARRYHTKRGTPKRLWPKRDLPKDVWKQFHSMRDYLERSPAEQRSLNLWRYGCPACVEANERTRTIHPCYRGYVTKDGGTVRFRPSNMANPGCGYFNEWCENHGIIAPRTFETSFEAETPRLREYFDTDNASLKGERGLAWREWFRLYTRHGAPLLKDCEEVFTKWKWNSSYGGAKWGQAARFAHLFAAGQMRPAMFLDRVWTLEHNGGNLFNKFYTQGLHNLMNVLAIQSEDEQHYPWLIKHASPYTQELYAEAEQYGVLNRAPQLVGGAA